MGRKLSPEHRAKISAAMKGKRKTDEHRVRISVSNKETRGAFSKYGLTKEEWLAILERQGGACPICLRKPPEVRLVTDHEHVRDWKRMPPEERKRYVRGLLCVFCNFQRVNRNLTAETAQRAADYLRAYEGRNSPRNLFTGDGRAEQDGPAPAPGRPGDQPDQEGVLDLPEVLPAEDP